MTHSKLLVSNYKPNISKVLFLLHNCEWYAQPKDDNIDKSELAYKVESLYKLTFDKQTVHDMVEGQQDVLRKLFSLQEKYYDFEVFIASKIAGIMARTIITTKKEVEFRCAFKLNLWEERCLKQHQEHPLVEKSNEDLHDHFREMEAMKFEEKVNAYFENNSPW